jgi:hypothetical protein
VIYAICETTGMDDTDAAWAILQAVEGEGDENVEEELGAMAHQP